MLVLPIGFCLPEISVTPSVVDVDVFKNVRETFTINISNVGDKDIEILNFSSLDYFTFPAVENFSANSTVEYEFSVQTDSVFEDNFESIASFYYISDIAYEGVDVEVSITDHGFEPQNFTCFVNDKLIFRNTDSVGHTVTRYPLGSGFDDDVSPGGVLEKVVTEEGIVAFYDREYGYSAQWQASQHSTDTLTHNSDLDEKVYFRVRSVLKDSNFSVDFLDGTEFSVDWNGTVKGVMKITDYAANGLFGVSLSSDSGWVSFDRNNFDISPSDHEYVDFHIKPSGIEQSNQTGKVYPFKITVDSTNSPSESFDLQAYINSYDFYYHKPFVFDIVTDGQIQDWVDFYCKIIPESELTESQKNLCNNLKINVTVPVIQEENVTLTGDIQTVEDIETTMDDIKGIITTGFNLFNKRLDKIENVTNFLLAGYSTYEEDLKQKKQERLYSKAWGYAWTIAKIILLIVGVATVVVIILTKRGKKEEQKAF